MCDDIGSAAYDARSVAAALVETLALVERERPNYVRLGKMRERWGINPEECSGGEEFINRLAQVRAQALSSHLSSRRQRWWNENGLSTSG
jgi:hypothetical protein